MRRKGDTKTRRNSRPINSALHQGIRTKEEKTASESHLSDGQTQPVLSSLQATDDVLERIVRLHIRHLRRLRGE